MTNINKITEEDVLEFEAYPTFLRYQLIATKSAIYPGRNTPIGLMYTALKLNGEAGELAEHVGKAMRDDGFGAFIPETALTKERRALIIKELGDVLWYISAICNELNISLPAVALRNLEKLKDRTDRQKLQGSGDDR